MMVRFVKIYEASFELIDTLWTVNESRATVLSIAAEELIDTLWNVNFFRRLAPVLIRQRINRYIMECK